MKLRTSRGTGGGSVSSSLPAGSLESLLCSLFSSSSLFLYAAGNQPSTGQAGSRNPLQEWLPMWPPDAGDGARREVVV